MKQSTTFACVANKFSKVLQGYTKGIRFVAVLTMLLTMGIGQAWADKGFFGEGQWNIQYWDGSGDKWGNSYNNASTYDLGIKTTLYLKEGWVKTWSNGGWTQSYVIWYWGWSNGSTTNNWRANKSNVQGDQTWNFNIDDYDLIANAPNNPGYNTLYMHWRLDDYISSGNSMIKFTIPGFTTTSASQSFDNTTVSSNSSKTISFGQHYGTALNANNCVISGTNKSEFSVTSITETNVTVKFAPTSAGNKSATLTITDAHGKVCTVALSGKTQYVVTYSKGNYGAGSNKTVYKVYGTNLTLADKGNFTRENYTQTAWNTNADGTSGTSYALNANYTKEAAITLYPTWTGNPQTVTWKVNGETYNVGSPSTSVAYGSKVTTLPTAPSIDCNGKVFVGWSNQKVTDGLEPTVLFTTAGNAPDVTGATTYHAVFADQEGFDGNVDFSAQGWTNGEDLDIDESTDIERIFNIAGVTLQFFKNSGSYTPQYYTTGEAIRLYPKNQMKVSVPSDRKITSINFTFSTGDGNNTISPSVGSFDGTTWTDNASSVTFTIGGETGHRRISSIQVSVDGAGTVSYSNYTTSCIPIYTITYDLNGGSGSCAEAEVEKGSKYTICATTPIKEGYIFQGWEYNGTTYREGETISNIQSDITLVAQWNPITYSVVFDANGGTGTMERQTFTYDDAQSLTANTFTRDKYEFAGWNTATNGSGTSYDDEEEVENLTTSNGATITLYAQWDKLYTVTFYNIGSLLETKTQEIVGGSIACPTINAPCDGYEFVGWSETAVANNSTSYTDVSCPITPTEDTELYAVYSQEAEGGGTEVATLTTSEISGAYIKNTTTQYGNYTINSQSGTWGGLIYIGENYIQISANTANRHLESPTFSGNISNITITGRHNATKSRNIYICSSNSIAQPSSGDIGRGTIASSGISNQYTDWTDVAITVSGNYTKFYVYADGGLQIQSIVVTYSGGGSTTTYTTTPDCCTPLAEITGMTFSAMTRSITVSVPDGYDNTNMDGYIFNLYNAATGGTATTTYETNDKNEKSHTFTGLNPNTEYYFTIIAKGSGAYCNSEETSPRESHTTLPQYTVTWKPNGGNWSGSTADKVDTYDYQAAITKPADPERKGYTFNGWDRTPETTMPAENLIYTAQWNIVTYTITYENLNGATHTNPEEYTVETAAITLTDPTERAGYVFAGWYSDANYTTKVTQIPQGSTGNITLYAKWLEMFTITWMANGVVYATTEVVEGEAITPPASPDAGDYCGQVFAGWTDVEMAETSANAPTLYPTPTPFPKASADATFYAVFADYKE